MGSNPIRVIYGGLAQLGEHLPYKQRVGGSNPSASTINIPIKQSVCFAGNPIIFRRTGV